PLFFPSLSLFLSFSLSFSLFLSFSLSLSLSLSLFETMERSMKEDHLWIETKKKGIEENSKRKLFLIILGNSVRHPRSKTDKRGAVGCVLPIQDRPVKIGQRQSQARKKTTPVWIF
ncbi:MAG: hypothetical protein Q8P67_12430, partial [archaeon]|nr:hypothetical protein [archaeon]